MSAQTPTCQDIESIAITGGKKQHDLPWLDTFCTAERKKLHFYVLSPRTWVFLQTRFLSLKKYHIHTSTVKKNLSPYVNTKKNNAHCLPHRPFYTFALHLPGTECKGAFFWRASIANSSLGCQRDQNVNRLEFSMMWQTTPLSSFST